MLWLRRRLKGKGWVLSAGSAVLLGSSPELTEAFYQVSEKPYSNRPFWSRNCIIIRFKRASDTGAAQKVAVTNTWNGKRARPSGLDRGKSSPDQRRAAEVYED
jgi:hypothetical protein